MNFHGGYFGSDALVDFSVNIPPLPYPTGLKELIMDTFEQIRKYPEIDGISACEAIAKNFQLQTNQIILGNGATELIYLYARSIGVSRALVLEPTFTEYRRALELNQVEVESFSLLDFAHSEGSEMSIDMDNEDLLNQIIHTIIEREIELLVICNPNNPTGHLYSNQFIKKIIKGVKSPNFQVFIDESFLDFVSNDKIKACTFEHEDLKQIFLLRSMTKNFEVPGLRIGYGVSHPTTIEKLKQYKEPWSLNAFALKAIPFLINQTSYLETIKEWCEMESDYISEHLKEIRGLKLYKGTANFLLIQIPDLMSETFFDQLVAKNVYLRKCEDFKGLGKAYYRIAIRERSDNQLLINAIKEVFNEYEL